MYTADVPRALIDLAAAMECFNEMVQTEYIEASEVWFNNPASHRRFGKIFTKYRVLGLDRYEKVLLLDADLYVRANLDHLFDLQPPAAMARGKNKPPQGELLPKHAPINAGVMLLRPDPQLLAQILEEITGPQPRKPPNYNSPDADYLTEHPAYCGKWTSIPLEFNYQLQFDEFDPKQAIVRFSKAREEHFSEEGASMPWSDLKVVHFSGAKPWPHLLEDASIVQRLRADCGSQPALAEKLVTGIREYAREVAEMQGLCSQLQLGEGTLWKEVPAERKVLACTPELARGYLHSALPPGGRWFEGQRARTAVWIPPGEGRQLPGAPFDRRCPVGTYLEIADADVVASLTVGDTVRTQVGGVAREYEIAAIHPGSTATLRRQITLPAGPACNR